MKHRAIRVLLLFAMLIAAKARSMTAQALYGFGFLPGQTDWTVFSIDPPTGAFTPIDPVGNLSVSTSAFDPTGQRLFFLSPPSTLYTVNLTTGAITTATVANCCAFLYYDSLSAKLYGFGFLPAQTDWTVFSIDQLTGAFTPIVAVGNLNVSTSAFDPVGKRLFFLSPPSTLYTVSLTTGAITTATVASCCAFLYVGAGTTVAVPLLHPVASFVLLGMLGLLGWRLAKDQCWSNRGIPGSRWTKWANQSSPDSRRFA